MKNVTSIELGRINVDSSYTPTTPLWPDWLQDEKPADFDEQAVILKPNKLYHVQIRYPLTNRAVHLIKTGETGITIREFVNQVVAAYQEIYKTENETTKIPAGQASPTLLNRNKTDGKYGIWGHGIEDLNLCQALINHKTGIVEIEVDS